jgi:hypothetical protein
MSVFEPFHALDAWQLDELASVLRGGPRATTLSSHVVGQIVGPDLVMPIMQALETAVKNGWTLSQAAEVLGEISRSRRLGQADASAFDLSSCRGLKCPAWSPATPRLSSTP